MLAVLHDDLFSLSRVLASVHLRLLSGCNKLPQPVGWPLQAGLSGANNRWLQHQHHLTTKGLKFFASAFKRREKSKKLKLEETSLLKFYITFLILSLLLPVLQLCWTYIKPEKTEQNKLVTLVLVAILIPFKSLLNHFWENSSWSNKLRLDWWAELLGETAGLLYRLLPLLPLWGPLLWKELSVHKREADASWRLSEKIKAKHFSFGESLWSVVHYFLGV